MISEDGSIRITQEMLINVLHEFNISGLSSYIWDRLVDVYGEDAHENLSHN